MAIEMRFVISRKRLVDGVDYLTMTLGHHAENAARARVYAGNGNRYMARWYGHQARQDLASYFNVRKRLAANET